MGKNGVRLRVGFCKRSAAKSVRVVRRQSEHSFCPCQKFPKIWLVHIFRNLGLVAVKGSEPEWVKMVFAYELDFASAVRRNPYEW